MSKIRSILFYTFISPTALSAGANAQPAAVAQAAQAGNAAGGNIVASEISAGDIIVTAQKSSQSLQRVPAAVSVVNSAILTNTGVTNLSQIGNLASGLSITPVRTQSFIFLRGVGQTLTTPNADAAIATNLNGVYLPAEIAGTAFFDIDRIEIVPGPQGTLYGRNAAGGVVNLVSRMPGADFGADGFVEIGNYRRRQVVLGLDAPLSGALSSRTSGTVVRRKGYFTDGLDDEKTTAIRQTLVWRPLSSTRVEGVFTYNHSGGLGSTLQTLPYMECGSRCTAIDPDALGYFNRVNTYQGSLKIEQNLALGVTLTYLGGYNRMKLRFRNTIVTGPPATPLDLDEKIKGQSHEARINVDRGAWDAILGLYYFDQDTFYRNDVRPSPATHLINPFNARSDGQAVFGQLTYSISEKLRTTGGLRYSRTKKNIDGVNNTLTASDVLISVIPYSGASTLRRTDWKIGLEYDLAQRSMIYANISTGFNPGGFSTAPAIATSTRASPFDPATLTAYAAGIKNRLFDGLLNLNFEGFYYDYRNYQVSARVVATGQNNVFNAEKATVYGAQADIRLVPTRQDQLNIAATYLHSQADRLRVGTTSYDGFQLPYSPRWTVNANYQHIFELSGGAELRGSVNLKYTSHRWALYTHAANTDIGTSTKADINFGYFSRGERWSMQAFVRNVGNDLVKTTCVTVGTTAACGWEPPRTYGVNFGFKI